MEFFVFVLLLTFFQVTLPYLNEKYEWILGAAHISPSEIDNICVNTEQIGIDNC